MPALPEPLADNDHTFYAGIVFGSLLKGTPELYNIERFENTYDNAGNYLDSLLLQTKSGKTYLVKVCDVSLYEEKLRATWAKVQACDDNG